MIGALFNTFFYLPMYNGLIFLIDLLPGFDMGLVIVVFTIIVKLFLLPLSLKAIRSQKELKEVEPELKEIRKKYEKDKKTQALKMMELYKERKIKPFSSFLLILIQLPIIFALYYVFLKSGLPEVTGESLYSFVSVPSQIIPTTFLGIFDVTKKSLVLSLIAGATQFIQTSLSMPSIPKVEGNDMKAQMARNIGLQMKYIFPIIVIFISYTLNSAIAIYWTTSNIFHIGQELYVKKGKGVKDQSAIAL